MESSSPTKKISLALRWLGDLTARASTTLVVVIALVTFLIVLIANGSPDHWQVIFSTITESVALVMLFVIQHSQSRQQIVTQLKLDELLRATPRADDLLVHLEVADDAELIEREQSHLAHHESLREVTDE